MSSSSASESELDYSLDPVASLTSKIAALTADVPIANAPKLRRPRIRPFRFFDLPSELRVKVYEHHFADVGEVVDLDSDNYKRIHKKLGLLRTCRLIYKEASYLFYSTHTTRIFPIYGKFFKTKKPLLARMTEGQRASITTLELRLGPGWNRPPRGWVVNDALGLKGCIGVRRLKVFVECDPSNDVFKGFRHADGFYEEFSRGLFDDVLGEMPWLKVVEFDANPSVKKNGAMMRALLGVAERNDCTLAWGPEKGWDDGEEKEEEKQTPLANFLPIGGGAGHLFLNNGGHGYNGLGHNVMVLA